MQFIGGRIISRGVIVVKCVVVVLFIRNRVGGCIIKIANGACAIMEGKREETSMKIDPSTTTFTTYQRRTNVVK